MSRLKPRFPLPITLVLGLLVAATLSASGCGRRGSPEAPPSAAVATEEEIAKNPELAPPPKRFVLDPLID
jgi:predicted small lipoprotein YifL